MQRILEQRLPVVLDRILVKPSLSSPVPMEKGGYLQVDLHLGATSVSSLGRFCLKHVPSCTEGGHLLLTRFRHFAVFENSEQFI